VNRPISIAIETSSRRGGAALGAGEELLAEADFDASARHGVQLVGRLAELVASASLRPSDLEEVYVSVGPGSFTGTRIGVTVARTLAHAVGGIRCVAVPGPDAVAEAARQLDWRHLGVILDARGGLIHATRFDRPGPGEGRAGDDAVRTGPGRVIAPADFLAQTPRPLMLLGEGLGYHDLRADGVTIPRPDATDAPPHVPTAASVWRVGRRLAAAGRFTEPAELLPIYSRTPRAQRVWDEKHDLSGH